MAHQADGTVLGTTIFQEMAIYAGGFVTGIAHQGATKACCMDVFNSYIWGADDDRWRPLFTTLSMDADELANVYNGALSDIRGGFGVALAATDPAYVAAGFCSRFYFSTNTGHTMTRSALAPKRMFTNTGTQRVWNGSVIAINPTNKMEVLLGTSNDGVYFTQDFGATEPEPVNGTIPDNADLTTATPYIVAIAPNGIDCYIQVQGTGLYHATGVDGTFTLMEDSPVWASDIAFFSNGDFLTCEPFFSGLNKYDGVDWSTMLTGSPTIPAVTVAIDPDDDDHIVATDLDGFTVQSYDGGATWIGPWQPNYHVPDPNYGCRLLATDDVVWLAGSRRFPAHLEFNPDASNELWEAQGLGVDKSNPPATQVMWDWHYKSAGIRELVSNGFISVPGNDIIALEWDKPTWKLGSDLTNLNGQPRSYPGHPGIHHAWAADYAADNPGYIGIAASDNGNALPMFSEDGGDTYELTFPGGFPEVSGDGPGGTIAINEQAQQIYTSANNKRAICTEDNWATRAFLPLDEGLGNWINASYVRRHCFAADKERPGVFAAVMNGDNQGANRHGLWVTTTGPIGTGGTLGGWTRKVVGRIDSTGDGVDFWSCRLAYIPGKSGEMLYTSGVSFASRLLHFTSDAASGSGTALGAAWGMTDVVKFDFGKAMPGQPYPCIFFVGTVSGVFGLHRSHDFFATQPVLLATHPVNSLDFMICVGGDMNIAGRCYPGFLGSGGAFGDLVDARAQS